MQCIGRMGGNYGDWFAELDFERDEAVVHERKPGGHEPLATVPLGAYTAETADEYAKLDPDSPQNKRLCAIVFAPEAWALLRSIRERLLDLPKVESAHPPEDVARALEIATDEIIADIETTLECLEVPRE